MEKKLHGVAASMAARAALKSIVLGSKMDRPMTARRYARIEKGEVSLTVGELMEIAPRLNVHPYAIICERNVGEDDVVLLNNFLLLLEKGEAVPFLPHIRNLINKAVAEVQS